MAHRANPLSRGLARALILLPLALLEVAWLTWFLIEPLPNAKNIGGIVRRWILLARALPEVVPDVRFEESYLGLALSELRHVEYLPQRLPVLLAAALIAGAAWGLGNLILRTLKLRRSFDPLPRAALAYGLGATALGSITLVAGRLGLLSPWPVRVGLLATLLAELALIVRDARSRTASADPLEFDTPQKVPKSTPSDPSQSSRTLLSRIGLVLVVGPFLLLMLLGAMLPSIDFDGIEYHLQGPKEYFQTGRIAFLPHNVYTSMPFSIEMLHLLGMEVLRDWWWGALAGQVLVAAFAPAAAVLIAAAARQIAGPRAGWIAAVVYLSTPWVYRLGVLPYVEGPLCYYHAALVWASLQAWDVADRSARRPLWTVVGLLAGGAMACKYPALISAVLPFGLLSLVASIRRRSWDMVILFSLGWAAVMTPWMVKNVVDTGNPVYPLGYGVFGGRHWDSAQDAKWSHAHGPRAIEFSALVMSVVDVAGRSDWQSPLYLALAPLAFLRPGLRRYVLPLAGFVAYLFFTWWLLTHRLDRFWLPLLPPLAILAGLGGDWLRSRLWTLLLLAILIPALITNLTYVSTALAGFNEWTADLIDLRDRLPRMLNPPLARLDTQLPPDARPLLIGQAGVFHVRHPIVYNTVFNLETFEGLAKDRSPEQTRQALLDRGITHVYVDWHEIERYRSPGNYGFTDFETPELFAGLVKAGVLTAPELLGTRQELYRVKAASK